MADGYISQVKLPNNNTYDLRDQNLKVYTGSCTTAAGTAIKDVTTDGAFTLAKGAVVFVNFSATNTAAVANLKLKFNGEADANAKPIKYLVNSNDPANIPGTGYLRANQTYMFQYDGTNWVVGLNYYTYSNDFASRLGHYNNILARKAITAESLIVGDATGYEKVASGVTFDLAYPIVWCTAAVAANASNYANMFLQHYDRNIATGAKSGFTSSANKVIYLIVTINGNIATVDSNIITDTLPSSEDGKVYIVLGKLGAQSTGANYFFLYPTHPMFEYKNGMVRTYEAAQNLSELSGADDLKAIEALTGTSGFLKKTAANTWALDTNSYSITSHTHNYLVPLAAGISSGEASPNNTLALAIKKYFDENKTNIPRNKLISFQVGAYSNALYALGHFIDGYNDSPYGGFFTVHYLTPRFLGIANGSYEESKLARINVTNTTTSGQIMIADGTDGKIKTSGYTIATSVPANAVFTDTNKYHKTGSWSGLTYTATAVNSADELKFTIPTGTSSTTVAVGDHTHGWANLTDNADSLAEGTSNWTDNTEILTSYASNNGFADTNSKGKVYRRDAICAYNYIKGKLDSVYAAKATTLSGYGITDAVYFSKISSGISSGSGAAETKAYWANNTAIPKNSIKAVYNTQGTEYSLLFSNNNNNYGTVLKWGYSDKYIRILRYHYNNGTYTDKWYSEDWEKISAGYADTAGNITGTLTLANLTKGDANTALMGKGSSTAPAYVSVSPSISITAGTADNAPKVNLTVLGVNGQTAQELTKATTGVYGATKLSSTLSDSEVLAATPKMVNTLNTKVDGLLAAANAMQFKGTLGTGGTITTLPDTHDAGDTYRVITAGTWAGKYCEVGTLIICVNDGTTAADADWTSVETNEDGAVIGPAGTNSSTDNAIVRWDGTSGRIIQNSKTTVDDNGHIAITHVAGSSNELEIKYSTTIDYWWGVGTGNENHGMYDVKKSAWVISAGTDNVWSFVGNASTATTLAASKTLWGQSFNGGANVTGSMTNVGPDMKLPSGQTAFNFYTSSSGAANAKFGKLGLNSTYANIDLTNYTLDVNGKTRVLDTIYRPYSANDGTPMIWMNGSDYNNWLWQISSGTTAMYYGYGLKYIGAGSGVANYLRLYADNQNGTEVIAVGINQNGQLGIGTDANTGYRVYVDGQTYLNGITTINGDIIFPTANKLDWNSDTYRQRIVITDDSTANTAVFSFQQSTNSGTNYTDLFVIRDNGTITSRDIYHYNANGATDASLVTGAIGTANSGDGNVTQGAQGTAILTLGNATARPASGTAGGANNSAGYIRMYNSGTTYSQMSAYGTWNYMDTGLALPTDKVGIMFRPSSSSYYTHFSYQTGNNEALVMATQNVVTSFIFVNGESYANISSTRWRSLTPALQIKNNSVIIGKLIDTGVTPSYKFEVNGTSSFSSEVRIVSDTLWVQGGSEAGNDTNRMGLTSGMPSGLAYNTNKRGVRIYANAIAFADPLLGNSGNDAGWIRHLEETANQGVLEIAVGNDNANEQIVVRRYNTSNTIGKEIKLLDASGNASFPGILAASTLDGTILKLHQGTAADPSLSGNARIEFDYSGGQPVVISYTPNDGYRAPAGLKIMGGTSATPAWFEVEGNIYAAAFKGNADTATSAGKWTTARTLTIGSTGKSVDGSGNVSWTLAEIGAAASSHEHSYIGKDHYIAYPSDGHYENNNNTVTGYIKIKIPKTKSATMLRFTVDIYNYTSYTATQYYIAGYNFTDASWNQCTAYCLAPLAYSEKANLTVRFLSNGNDEMYVTIGETNTSWSYPKVVIHDIILGHSGCTLDNWKSGWTVTLVDTAFDDNLIKATFTNTNIAYTTNALTATPSSTLNTLSAIDNFLAANKLQYGLFKITEENTLGFGSNDGMILSIPQASTNYGAQIIIDDNTNGIIKFRGKTSSWGAWRTIIHDNNYTSYTVKKDGTGATGTWGISITGSAGSCTGNAATATRINGNLGAINSATSCNIWVSSTASADGIPKYVSGVYVTASTGVLTAKGFSGPLTGDVTGNVTGNVSGSSGSCTGNAATSSYPAGFSSRSTNATWGNQTGTTVTCWNETDGGSIDFRKNNPSSGKISIKVDGRFYGNEGTYPAMLMSDPNNTGYWGLCNPDATNNVWLRTTTLGLIPFQAGSSGSGHGSLGTSSWYFSTAYIDNVYGYFNGNLSGNAATASKVAAKLDTTHKTYLLGTQTAITGTAANVELTGDTGVYLWTDAGSLSAKSYMVNDGTNEKVVLQWNSTDQSLDFVFA